MRRRNRLFPEASGCLRVAGMLAALLTLSACSGTSSSPARPASTHTVFGTSVCSPRAAGSIEQYPLASSTGPNYIVSGPDNNLWFTSNANELNKLTVGGTLTQYTDPNLNEPNVISGGMAANRNGLWFADSSGQIDNVTVNGVFTAYPIPHPASGVLLVEAMTTDPNGDLWFLLDSPAAEEIGELPVNYYGQVGAIREFPLPATMDFSESPGLTSGPDGNLWLSVSSSNGRSGLASMTAGGSFTFHSTPTPAGDVVLGPNGELWFTPAGNGVNAISEMTTSGVVTSFSVSIGNVGTTGGPGLAMTVGSDGNLWITSAAGNTVTRVTLTGTSTVFPLPTSGSLPLSITAGPDGNLWFTEAASSAIGRISPAATIHAFPLPPSQDFPVSITSGPDGNLWFTARAPGDNAGYIGRLDPMTGAITEFPTSPPATSPTGITSGPDGNLWFTDSAANKIGRITPQGVITEFPLPTANSDPNFITSGPDGDLWFTESSANQLGRITPQGVITEFPLPQQPEQPDPQGLVAGPDGNLWVTTGSFPGATLIRVTPTGVATVFPLPQDGNVEMHEITVGANGALWFDESIAVGQVTTQGTFSTFPLPVGTFTDGITSGPENKVWLSDQLLNRIYSMSTTGAYTFYPIPFYRAFPEDMVSGHDGNLWFTQTYGNQIDCLSI